MPDRASRSARPIHGRRPAFWARAAFVLLFISLALLRAWRTSQGLGTYTNCANCYWLPSLGHDAWLLAALLGVLAVACLAPWRWLSFGLALLAGLVVVFFAVDIVLDSLLSQRMYLGDMLRFGRHIDANFSVVAAGALSAAGLLRGACVVATILVVGALCKTSRRDLRAAGALAIGGIVAGAFSAYALSRPLRYVNEVEVYNIVESNLPQGRVSRFSADFAQSRQRIAKSAPQTCSQRPAAFSGNVIVVLVESLSAWQSRLLGGPFDWTPGLDRIAAENHYFTNFHANGFTTGGAEIALVTGDPALIPEGSTFFDLHSYWDLPDSLADIAHRSGRTANFFSTGELTFIDAGDWLRNMRFDVVNGGSDPFYAGMRRWQFGAAEDAALYDRYLAWLDDPANRKPQLSVLLTVSTHPPFVDPRTARIDPEAAFRYVDEQIDRFHHELERRGFFENGILLVLGDHRTMTPLHRQEFRAFGERAFSRVPLIVAGAVDLPKVVTAQFQQTDVKTSLSSLFGLETCTSPLVGDFLRQDPVPPRYVLHSRGDDRNRVDVYWGDDELSVYFYDGDRSHWRGPPPPDADLVSAWIDSHRMRPAPKVGGAVPADP